MDGSNAAKRPLPATSHHRLVEDWEDWDDDHIVTPVHADEPHVVQPPPPVYTRERPSTKSAASRASRHSSAKMKRLRSRRRQKAQNAKAGIKLVTDMAVFKRGNHAGQQACPADPRPVKFVDAAALKALEGEPSSASVGNWNWLNKDAGHCPNPAPPRQPAPAPAQELSPEDRPIVIGISLPPDQVSSPEATPQRAGVGVDTSKAQIPAPTGAMTSVWSPDTPDSINSFSYCRAASSVYSRAFTPGLAGGDKAPPVPALPASYQKTPQQGLASIDLGGTSQSEDDSGTPCTLFEEDGNSPAHKQTVAKGLCMSPDSATSRSHGWWDHVVTPFLDKKLSFSSRKMKAGSPRSEAKSPRSCCEITENRDQGRPSTRNLLPVQAPIVRKPTPRKCSSPSPSIEAVEASRDAETQARPEAVAEGAPAKNDRRRVCLVLWVSIISLMILIIILAVVLTRRHHETPRESHSIWVNLTDFPPMPTGVLTVVGPDNNQHDTVVPYKPNQPTVVMQIQWDNSSQSRRKPVEANMVRRGTGAASWAHDVLGRRQATPSFTPEPGAPSREEIWFLGNTTDSIQSENKAGEPTPFYISLLKSVHDPVKGSVLSRRQPGTRIGNESLEKLLPAPELEANGTPAPAVMLPSPVQQPVRLFDRGLPTEHYGFYTHFKRSLFLKSVTILNKTDAGNIPLDEGGGCRKDEANHLVTWGETRVLIQIWTRTLGLNTSSLLRPDESRGIGGTGELIRPGTMPYPVTVTLDTHGGDPIKKLVWSWPLDKRQAVGVDKAELLANNMGVGGTWINPRGTGDGKMGGFDGGSGGCRRGLVARRRPLACSLEPPGPRGRTLLTLAIETSCDDTAVAVLSQSSSTGRTALLFNERISSDNREFRGVKPSVAVQGHNASLAPLVRRALAALPDAADDATRVVEVGGGTAASGEEQQTTTTTTTTTTNNNKGAMLRKRIPDLVAVTRGPGIPTNLAVGLSTAKGLAVAWDVPLLGVHHMQAHALTPRLARALEADGGAAAGPEFPFLTLLVSGGHTQLVRSASLTEHAMVVDTCDVAVGNLLDQAARHILPPEVMEASPDVMYGRELEAFAFPPAPGPGPEGDDVVAAQHGAFFRPARSRHDEMVDVPSGYDWAVTLPFRHSRRLVFSFGGIYAQVHRIAAARPHMDLPERRALARHTLRAAFQHIASRLCLALDGGDVLPTTTAAAPPTLVVAGGVACNRFLAHVLRSTLAARGFPAVDLVVPPLGLCTDNAAMVAWAASEMYRAGWETELSVSPIRKWPMDPAAGGEGLLGVEGSKWRGKHCRTEEQTSGADGRALLAVWSYMIQRPAQRHSPTESANIPNRSLLPLNGSPFHQSCCSRRLRC
ncbi:glycoprotease family protein [Hirsutella rhossiliensis]|uniref:Glycoprotease family domain-containing protein n=1 Tax=Hirsutella rhossiliensis TaxID=111463 RepID=A0A9P8SJJ9_9HYPO|nr:glycoprotease family domain-containing protein [Hirsutella rhossiliensis]KAH0963111.1 glycoprotease family domain-containing protein [Hirsutella rhossiliensis]